MRTVLDLSYGRALRRCIERSKICEIECCGPDALGTSPEEVFPWCEEEGAAAVSEARQQISDWLAAVLDDASRFESELNSCVLDEVLICLTNLEHTLEAYLSRPPPEPLPPPLDLLELRHAVDSGRSFVYRFFWGHRPHESGWLTDSVFSQWWQSRFVVDGREYGSAEQFMMASKARLFGDQDAHTKILATESPVRCKTLGRKVRGFDEGVWATSRFDIVTRGSVAKFGATPEMRAYLLSTRDEVLVEASPYDRIWGIGLPATDPSASDPRKWLGQNLLGFALMQARHALRA